MFARGQIVAESAVNVPVIPATALVPDAAGSGYTANTSSDQPITSGTLLPPSHVVVITPDNKAQVRPVKVGIANVDRVQITSGLNVGERIVTTGQQDLKSGDKVAIQNSRASGAEKVSEAL
jgi:hypothetical protein